MELRTDSPTYSSWDTETLYDKVLAFYEVDTKIDFPLWRPDSINLVKKLTTPSSFSDPDIKVTFNLLSINEENAIVSIDEFSGKKLKGMSLIPFSDILSEVISIIPHEVSSPITLPDTDLHVFSDDGKHIGVNYETGEYEMEILEAFASGDWHPIT